MPNPSRTHKQVPLAEVIYGVQVVEAGMDTVQGNDHLRTNLIDLHRRSVKTITLLSLGLSYAWFLWGGWLGGIRLSVGGWVGLGLLSLASLASTLLRERHVYVSAHLLVWGILGAVALVVFASTSLDLACLFVVPIVFASVFLGVYGLGAAAALAALITVSAASVHGEAWYSSEAMMHVMVIVLAAAASWVFVHNLYTSLSWVWHGYERARSSETTARERQAELKRALKALDEAAYRLERTNFMLGLARDQAVEAQRLKQQFAQTISHELRTPLNLIVGFTELMAHSPEYYGERLSPAYLRDLGIVYRNACHVQDLVDDVLDLARIDAAQLGLSPEEVDPAALTTEAVETARSLVEARGLALRVECEPDLPQLWVDPTRIRQVLLNLLNNAARFTESGGITVRVHRREQDILFAVTDTGTGIAPEDIGRIFEEFYQIDGSTRRPHQGAGLGLAISRRFVELHSGRIWVESRVGQGSTFTFSLPVNRVELKASVDGRLPMSERALAPQGSEEHVLLIVTQTPEAAALLTRHVRGLRTLVVSNLEQARRAAHQLVPQMVVVDRASAQSGLPDFQALAREWGSTAPLLLACSLPGKASLRHQLAANSYLTKPVSRQRLWDVMRQYGREIDRVLVVDDDQDFVSLVSRMLENGPVRRYQVTGAGTGQEGLALMRLDPPDLVLLDLSLPDIDGRQVIEHIRSVPEWQQMPIVIVSAQDRMDYESALEGPITIARADGLMPGEVVKLVQSVADAMVTRPVALSVR
jgi:signal transduction histidine kinase/DNA-binding response OmpR family regulator